MRSAQVLAQLALLTSSAHAFYPFTPKWLDELEEKPSLESRGSDVDSDGKDGVFPIKQRNREVSLWFLLSLVLFRYADSLTVV